MIRHFQQLFQLNPDYKNRVFGLDLMRALAIIFVVMRHGTLLEKANTNFPWIRIIDGVELFFVLSGFLIGGILLKIFEKTENLTPKTLLNFWIRRWFRTLPNYYLILLLNVVFVYYGFTPGDLSQFNWKFFLFIHNFSQPFYGFFWESWSLSIEEWFYLLFPITLGLLYVFSKKKVLTRKSIFLLSILIFLFVPFLLRYFIASKFDVDHFWISVKILKVVIYRLDGIALGLLAAFIKFYYPNAWFKSRNISFVLGIIISYVVLYSAWLPNDFSTKVYMITAVSLGCVLLLPKFDSLKTAPIAITKIVTHVSLISYSMYLINLGLVAEVITHNFPPETPLGAWTTYLVYWIIVLVFSTLLYKLYEKPMMDIRDRWKS